MIETRVKCGMSRGVTFVHALPLSRVTWTRPSSDPAQSTPAVAGDSARAKIVAYHSVPVMSRVTEPPTGPMVEGSCSVKSGLAGSQLSPSFVDRKTRLAATNSSLGTWREYKIGKVHWNRLGTWDDGQPS